jgi:DNA-binding HxlR family transcriptional regulator
MPNFDIHAIDEVIHGRLRLGVMAHLVGAGTADFTALRDQLKATDGNLSVQLRKLEEAGYVTIRKSFRARKPLTEVALTGAGRKAFLKYLDSMAGLLR